MPLLHVALQEGFSNDAVIIQVDDREVFNQSGIRTRNQIGLAKYFALNFPDGTRKITISVPSRQCSKTVTIDIRDPIYLGVSLTNDNRILHEISPGPFGYL
ncbi:MAG: hypothetical protein HYR55_04815 [Acidobacteria bacterium]|nr:hypothetical protein [Acidobacteriota bacterium]MBI3654979.1 hypothetical protein [Acidobacteriota bacterium]